MINDALCNIVGQKYENLIGKIGAESLPQKEMEHFLKIDREVLSTGKENVPEEMLTSSNGKTQIISTKKKKKTIYTDSSGKKFIVGVIRDITEKKKADDEVQKRTEELEKFNKLAIGRELEMVELKKKISELEHRLKS